ncbi:MAG: Crp/Fnr family transcriptional regulator [Deltaproteobacteria bacterium]|nr:Crp/Fnr family transcriptional regulator [Deltaproteobacteria bacterium]
MKRITDYIASIPLFSGMSPEHHDELAMIVVDQEFCRGDMIFSEGDAGNGFFVIIDGRVKIFKLSFEGKEQILHILGPGEPFAEVAVFTGSTYPANAMALEKSRLFFFPRKAFTELITSHPSLAMNMLATLSFRLKQFSHMIEALSLKEVPSRLAAYILLTSEQNDNAHSIKLTVSKTQLASLLGTIPETLSRILAKMTKNGLIQIDGSMITVLDKNGLVELAEGEMRL